MSHTPRTLTGSITIELTLNLTGTLIPAIPERGPTFSSGGEPAESASVSDVTIESITISEPYTENSTPKWREAPISGIDFDLLLNSSNIYSDCEQELLASIED